MPDAWEILISNSRLISGDAWEHLNAQSLGVSIEAITGELNTLDTSGHINIKTANSNIETLNARSLIQIQRSNGELVTLIGAGV